MLALVNVVVEDAANVGVPNELATALATVPEDDVSVHVPALKLESMPATPHALEE